MIEVRCFRCLEEAGFLRLEINALNRASIRSDPFSTFEFFENFLRCDKFDPAGESLQLWFLVAFDARSLVGYMALKRTTYKVLGMRAAKLDFLVVHDADRPQLVARSENARAVSEAFYAYLLERGREWDFLEFRQQEAKSPLFPPAAAARLKGYLVRQWPGTDNGTIHVCWSTLDAYFKSLSKKFRSNVSRQMRSLLAAGEVEYFESSNSAIIPALFELYQSVELHSWKSRTGVTIGRHPRWAEYFRGLLDAQQPMQVSIQILSLDGVPVAGLITGAFEQTLYALHIITDDSVSHLAPGSALLLMSLRQAISGGYAAFNLLSGFGYYKVRWQAQMSETRNVQIYRLGGLSYWHRVIGDWKRWLLPVKAHETPLLFNPIRRNVKDNEHTPLGKAPRRQLSGEESIRIAALIAEIRKGAGEFLSAKELAMVMPFETRRASQSNN